MPLESSTLPGQTLTSAQVTSAQVTPAQVTGRNQSSTTGLETVWDRALIAKYDVAAPRYTSYPTAPHFSTCFDPQQYQRALCSPVETSIEPLSLYIHIPFCHNICYYCACNKIVSNDPSVTRPYLDHLHKEMVLQSALCGSHRPVTQLHLGGGTPTFLDAAELTELMHHLAGHFALIDDQRREYSIEIDPRSITTDTLALLKGLGFNRISLGVQDFDARVQEAINRPQRYGLIETMTETARLHQFKSISFDLIYGLPYQTLTTLRETLAKVIRLAPDRIAFYNYAHLPQRFKSQRAIDRLTLPSAADKLDMLALISDALQSNGYVHIGMDHFVKPSDDLYVAQQEGRLQRNFQGYSTTLARDLIGLGVSSIGVVSDVYVQNARELAAYYRALDEGRLPIERGLTLTQDDKIRQAVITGIICNLKLDTAALSARFNIDFSEYFAQELEALLPLQSDGLLLWAGATLCVTERGRPMLRNICRVFDAYLGQHNDRAAQVIQFSKTL